MVVSKWVLHGCLVAWLCSLGNAAGQNILREYWLGLPGSKLADLTNAPAFQQQAPDGSSLEPIFEAPVDWADQYGTRMRGYVHPPQTGDYVFWISSDDEGALWLSRDELPANKILIARVATWTASRVWEEPRDGNAALQKSEPIHLEAGRRYYIEAMQKEGGGGDNLAVGWQLPDGTLERPIPGGRLSPWIVSDDPPAFTTEPTNVVVMEGATAEFHVEVQGAEPLLLQWQRDGADIAGATGTSYRLAPARLTDDGARFRCIARNVVGAVTSRWATLTVEPDTAPPVLAAISPAPGATLGFLSAVEVTFSEPVQGVDAADFQAGDIRATNVVGQGAGPYRFEFPPFTGGGAIRVGFPAGHGITDLASNPHAFRGGAWVYRVDANQPTGMILREVFLNIPGTQLSDLRAEPRFPYEPSLSSFETIFEAPVNWADEYGTRMRGYVHPPQTGDYIFWIASDDQGELYLSTDDRPENKILIARVPTWTASRRWEESRDNIAEQQRSKPQHLEAGRRYYIEALQKEGRGGDNLAVGWQLPDGTLERPIPGERLSHWVKSTDPPSLNRDLEDVTVAEGATVEFQVNVDGGEPLRFLWYESGVWLETEQDATLILPNVTTNDSGRQFQVIVTNSWGSVTSRVATLTVHPELVPPEIIRLRPAPGLTVRTLTQVEVTFSEPVDGVDASDLLVNDRPADEVRGFGSGPYVFTFPPQARGTVHLRWTTTHGIHDRSAAANPFSGGAWSYTLDPNWQPPDVQINEFVAANRAGLQDEDGEVQDWIELWNRSEQPVNLAGWSLTDDEGEPGKWVFPETWIEPDGYLVVFASGKDRRTATNGFLHTNFRLSAGGEYLGLFSPEVPPQPISELAPGYPEQRNDYAYGLTTEGAWRYFRTPTPGAPNGSSPIENIVQPAHFSVRRGYFAAPFHVLLSTPTEDAVIRYTTDGTEPTEDGGQLYTGPIRIDRTTVLRAAAFRTNWLPSRVVTHTYLYGLNDELLTLPALSLVTAPTNLTGRTGIIGMQGGTYENGRWEPVNPDDYYNPINKGIAWERPVSIEFIRPEDNSGFEAQCGIRVHASTYFRPRLRPDSKFSFRLYFRGDYGAGRLEYPWFPDSAVTTFNEIVLRAGSNDKTNPFIKDELVRRLHADMGQVASHGTFVALFINGEYKGYYNPCERIEKRFCQAWHGGSADWDVIEQRLDVVDGDVEEFNRLKSFIYGHDMSVPANYLEASRMLDMTNFVDYLLVNIYAGTGDWPGNNWRAGRERVPNGIWRFYIWDAEWAFGHGSRTVDRNTFENELAGNSEIARFYRVLKQSPEFRLLFADRIHKHFFNGGALTDEHVLARHAQLRAAVQGVIPNFNNIVEDYWVPNRRGYVMTHFAEQGLLRSENAPVFSQFGGRVPAGFHLQMIAPRGTIYYTTNGTDPRVPFTDEVAPDAHAFHPEQPLTLRRTTLVRARTLDGTNWSAMTEATFVVNELLFPVRLSEIMYHPADGEAYEFIELVHTGTAPVDLSGYRLEGVDYLFPQGYVAHPGQVILLASDQDPTAFLQRYPDVTPDGWFAGGLDNSGERLALLDPDGNILWSVDYQDANGWPAEADGEGASLERIDLLGNPDAPTQWQPSLSPGGSPGRYTPASPSLPPVRLNELMAANLSAVEHDGAYPDWLELYNTSSQAVDLSGWSLTDDSDRRKFVFPEGTSLDAGDYLVVWCDSATNAPGLHAGFALDADGESIWLFDAQTQRVDALTFGLQISDLSIGRDSTGAWILSSPTPGGPNLPAPVTDTTNVVINEWLANPVPGADDWIELFNRDTNRPADLGGIYLGNGTALMQLPPLMFMPPGGYLVFKADEQPGRLHLDFKLPASGSPLVLIDATGTETNWLYNPNQPEGTSRGRYPDGAERLVTFYDRATPGAPNAELSYTGPRLNEILVINAGACTNRLGAIVGFIELFNPARIEVELTGMSLSLDENEPGQWYFPLGTSMPPASYLVVWCDPDRPASMVPSLTLNLGRALDPDSGAVYLFDRAQRLVERVEYGPQVPNHSIGPQAGQWRLLATPTPDAPNSPEARLGPKGNLRINEWMARPQQGPDWFELYNMGDEPISLEGVFVTDDPSLAGQRRFALPPLSFVDAYGWVRLIADGEVDQGRQHVNFSLDAQGETLRLYQAGQYLIDAVDFGQQTAGVSEGRLPDGQGPVVSFPTLPTPGTRNARDSDADGLPDSWETAHGLNPNRAQDAAEDADHDGASNRSEYLSGTDPRDPSSRLVLHIANNAAGMVTLRFEALANRRYTLLCRERLDAGPWQRLHKFEALPVPRQIEFQDHSTNWAERWYLLQVE